jgi:hypothetical protein
VYNIGSFLARRSLRSLTKDRVLEFLNTNFLTSESLSLANCSNVSGAVLGFLATDDLTKAYLSLANCAKISGGVLEFLATALLT